MIKNISKNEYYSQEDFVKDCKCYIKALKSGRLQYMVTHVSNSGMSRYIFIQSYDGTMTKGHFRTYFSMLQVLGYKEASKYSSDIKVSGCGMNMLFKVNYDICHDFKLIGLINENECEILCQKIN
jgi:hypothetical protein